MQQQKLLSLIRQAIEDYNMIEEGDKICCFFVARF